MGETLATDSGRYVSRAPMSAEPEKSPVTQSTEYIPRPINPVILQILLQYKPNKPYKRKNPEAKILNPPCGLRCARRRVQSFGIEGILA